jgi:hypothetical protein
MRVRRLEERATLEDCVEIHVRHVAADDHAPDVPAGTVVLERVVRLVRPRQPRPEP